MVPEAKSTRIVKAFQEDKRERGVSKAFVEVALKDWGWGDGISGGGAVLTSVSVPPDPWLLLWPL